MVHKIVYFLDNYDSFGGAANTLLQQAVLMKQTGKAVCVAVSKYEIRAVCREYLRMCEKEEIPVYELGFSVTNQPEGVDLLSVLESCERIKYFLEKQNPELVHSVQLNPAVELACRELRVPHVMGIFQALPEFFVFPYPDIFAHFHICDSLYYAAFWQKHLGTKSFCVRTVAQRPSEEKRCSERKELTFICVGLVCERKNQLEVIKAFEIARSRGLEGNLQLLGRRDSSYADKCQQYILDHGLKDFVLLKGFMDCKEEIYQDSAALICGSTSESYPNVISEALANHVTVITTPVAGVPEIIKNRKNGYLCTGYSAAEIAEGILAFTEDVKTGAAKKLLREADSTYEAVHSPNAVTQRLEDVYCQILADYNKMVPPGYRIKDLEKDFGDFIQSFSQSQKKVTNRKAVKKNLWKMYFVIKSLRKNVLEQRRECYIWGTGTYGKWYKELLDLFVPEIRISGFIDSYKSGDCMGFQIFSAGEILSKGKPVILIGVSKSKEIIQELKSWNYHYGVDYFKFESIPW